MHKRYNIYYIFKTHIEIETKLQYEQSIKFLLEHFFNFILEVHLNHTN